MELNLVKVTPKIAAEMLEENTQENRSVKNANLERLIFDMKNGNWDANNGETLKFLTPKKGQKYGTLVDGQHRLHAIIASGKTYKLPCMTGVSDDAFTTLDSGSSRTMNDVLTSKSIPNAARTAAALVVLEQFYRGNFKSRGISHRALLKRFKQHPALEHYAQDAQRLNKVLNPSDAMFLSFALQSIDETRGKEFIDMLVFGGAEQGHPLHILREKLISLRVTKTTGRVYLPREYSIGSVFKCWNHIKRKSKEEFTLLRIGEDIEYPVGFADYFTDIEIGGIER